ncbi:MULTISPECIES: flavodoxin domain-containing protein [unclassified Ruminococcus]|uniref:flavodoxin domain-containing protein n=1 Tax=unclassified Ruminococcus TaxID=2608920 RepID=UPI00210C915F|nr:MULTISPECIES: flavodoxin domain-containing protein [unclassified Ruminococcus]
MSVLIVYGTKTGTSEKCAKYIADKLGEPVTLVNARDGIKIELSPYSTVIIGGSVRMGHITAAVSKFIEEEEENLLTKKVALFMCCGFTDEENINRQLEINFTPALKEHALCVKCFGGELHPDGTNKIDKLVAKMAFKADGDIDLTPELDYNAMNELVAAVKASLA